MAVLARGTVIAGHRIESFVGRGGMGVVYRARQIGLDRVVALKVIAPELLEDAGIRERFLQEARSAARIDHPNVIPVHAAGEDQGVAYIAMRFVDGDDLRSLVRRLGRLSPTEAAAFVAQAGAALDAIHGAGYVHRDVKPANLLVSAGSHVYLTDFGLAKQVLTRSGATGSGGWVGTLDYVSPEQVRGGRIDARADVYALGGVLYFMLTGHVPFEREGQEAKLWAQLRDPPPVPSALVPGLPRELDAVVARAMAKDPDDRYPSAGDLARAARAGIDGAEPSQPERMVARGGAAPGSAAEDPGIVGEAPTVSAVRETTVLARPRRWRPVAAALATAVAGAGIAALALRHDDTPSDSSTAAVHGTPSPAATATFAPVASATPALRIVKTARRVGMRPSGIVLAGRDAWIISTNSQWVTRVSRAGVEERRGSHPRVGYGGTSIAADGRSVWVAASSVGAVVRIDAATGNVTRRIPVANHPSSVAAGPSGLWVGTHPKGGGDELLHYSRSGSHLLGRRAVPQGVGPMALGGGALWIAGRLKPKIMRLGLRSGALGPWISVGIPANGLRYADGFLWASLDELDSIAKIDTRTPSRATADAGHQPAQLVVARGRVFVASNTNSRLVVLDEKSLDPSGPDVRVPFNPYAVAADKDGVWVTGLAGDTVTRLAYR